MAHLLRLIAICFFLFTSSAHAVIEPVQTIPSCASAKPSNVPAAGTIVGGCGGGTADGNGVISFQETLFPDGRTCQAGPICGAFGFQLQYSWTVGAISSCPANSISNGSGGCVCATNYQDVNNVCVRTNPCPAGQHEEGGACVPDSCQPTEIRVNGVCVPEPPCPPGQTRVNGRCVPSKCPPAGTGAGDGWDMSSEATEYACLDQGISFDGPVIYCTVRVRNTMTLRIDGKVFYTGSGKYTGQQCNGGSGGNTPSGPGGDGDGEPGDGGGGTGPGTGPGPGGTGGGSSGPGPTPPDPDKPPPDPPEPVPPDSDTGKCPTGTVRHSNGNCYPQTPPPTDPDSNGTCPEGKVKIGGKCVSPSPPGQPVPDKGTPDNPNPGGGTNGGGTGDDPDGGGDGGDSGFNGTCESGFACEGDAIQCAIAREQHARSCQLYDDKTSPEYLLYQTEKLKEGKGKVTGQLEGNREVDVSTIINSTDVFLGGGGSCPSDPTITLHNGASFVIPYSKLCPYFTILGNILVLISSISAALILIRRI